jgi:hypothetical protein
MRPERENAGDSRYSAAMRRAFCCATDSFLSTKEETATTLCELTGWAWAGEAAPMSLKAMNAVKTETRIFHRKSLARGTGVFFSGATYRQGLRNLAKN